MLQFLGVLYLPSVAASALMLGMRVPSGDPHL
jgi:hypothetical protein